MWQSKLDGVLSRLLGHHVDRRREGDCLGGGPAAEWHAQVVDVILASIIFPEAVLSQALHGATDLKTKCANITLYSAEYDAVNQGLVVASLIRAGANPDLLNNSGESCLIRAASYSHGIQGTGFCTVGMLGALKFRES